MPSGDYPHVVDNSSLPDPIQPDPLKKAVAPESTPRKPYAEPADAAVDALGLRASDADRERVAEALREAYAEGRLTAEEHSERVDSVYAAKTLGELVPLTRDLPAHGELHGEAQRISMAKPAPARGSAGGEPPARSEDPKMIAVFGGAERKGRFRAGSWMKAIAVFGGVEIDLSEAVFDEPELVIHCTAVFGGIEIKVPEHVTLRGGGIGIFGGSDIRQQEGADASSPVVVIKSVAVFGGVEAKRKRFGKLKEALRQAVDGGFDRGDREDLRRIAHEARDEWRRSRHEDHLERRWEHRDRSRQRRGRYRDGY